MSGATDSSASAAPSAVGQGRRALPWSARMGLATLAASMLLAAGADLLASDWPLLMRHRGELSAPALWKPESLRGTGAAELRADLCAQCGDWAIGAPIPFGPYRVELGAERPPAPPSARHWLGTDEVGRDVFARILHGTRYSLLAGLAAVTLYMSIGVLLGALAGFLGGVVDAVVSRLTEVLIAFPTVLLVLAAFAVVDRPGVGSFVVVLGLTRWPDSSRLVRAQVMQLKQAPFVEAARALGATPGWLLRHHLLPNAMGPILVAAAFEVAFTVLLESGLSMIGFGIPSPLPSWGELIAQAQRTFVSPGAWWLAVFPGLALFAVVSACNLVGDGLRTVLDPRAGRGVREALRGWRWPVGGGLVRTSEKARDPLDGNHLTG